MSKEAIIEKIMSDAEIRATAAVNEAKDSAESILADAAEACKAYLEQSKHGIDVAVEDIAKRGETVAELDARKLVLAAKSKVLDSVYSRAVEKAKNLGDKEYKKLILGMLDYAEDGDVVTLSKREQSLITAADIEAVAKKKGIKISLSKALGDFEGGVVLTGKGIDKNLTFEVEFALLRDETETQIAKELND